jgi:hypothetical protein
MRYIHSCFNSIATLGVHYAATFQSVFDKTATAYDFVCAMADRIYWLDDTYVQPFYAWAAPHLRDMAISGLFWGLRALINVTFWLADTAHQFMARDAHAITLSAFAQIHKPLPEFLTIALAAVPLESPSIAGLLMPIASALSLDLGWVILQTSALAGHCSAPGAAFSRPLAWIRTWGIIHSWVSQQWGWTLAQIASVDYDNAQTESEKSSIDDLRVLRPLLSLPTNDYDCVHPWNVFAYDASWWGCNCRHVACLTLNTPYQPSTFATGQTRLERPWTIESHGFDRDRKRYIKSILWAGLSPTASSEYDSFACRYSSVAVFLGSLNAGFAHIHNHDIPWLLELDELAFARDSEGSWTNQMVFDAELQLTASFSSSV